MNDLSGRCIQSRGTWLQFDFNDKEPNGNFRVKQFHFDYGYDLDKALQQLPLKELLNKGEADTLKEKLKSGDRISVSFVKDGNEQRFYIEANPQFRSVNIYDEYSGKVTLNTALGNKLPEAIKEDNDVLPEQKQSQKKRPGLRIVK